MSLKLGLLSTTIHSNVLLLFLSSSLRVLDHVPYGSFHVGSRNTLHEWYYTRLSSRNTDFESNLFLLASPSSHFR